MERVRKIVRPDGTEGQLGRPGTGPDQGDVLDELNNILRFAAPRELRPSPRGDAKGGHDMTIALGLIQRASEVMDQAEERASDIEARAIALAERAAGKLKDAEARILGAEQRAREAEARAEAAEQQGREAAQRADAAEERTREAEQRAEVAEQQAKDAGEWLARINASIRETFASRISHGPGAEIRRVG